jgi:hypothetical protein
MMNEQKRMEEYQREGERQRRLDDQLFSAVDRCLRSSGEKLDIIDNALRARFRSLAADDAEGVTILLISHADWMRRQSTGKNDEQKQT